MDLVKMKIQCAPLFAEVGDAGGVPDPSMRVSAEETFPIRARSGERCHFEMPILMTSPVVRSSWCCSRTYPCPGVVPDPSMRVSGQEIFPV
ncbi:uncharacterized protein LOC123442806 [Hordeum vulgare subsp. vulgare]|uniref:Predicted protein n=1 Tax=Hordeum vulgare subsp. vulgare TaxID=112509 RepID=F2CUZ8_HORVV|nr:uncharacterized protein LOC123442806 [Hordeum vulgare subsp. vulgare]KAI5004978.1 hypothetical protein ZWY2020_032221 [Hordeum vulgare]BAJ86669.1 predicted protein [Hordeum vulgare subsp. vulgare]